MRTRSSARQREAVPRRYSSDLATNTQAVLDILIKIDARLATTCEQLDDLYDLIADRLPAKPFLPLLPPLQPEYSLHNYIRGKLGGSDGESEKE